MEVQSTEKEKYQETYSILSTQETLINCNEKKKYKPVLKAVTNDIVKDIFKKPVLLMVPRASYPKSFSHNISNKTLKNTEHDSNANAKNMINLIQNSERFIIPFENEKETGLSLPYIEPLWSGKPQANYKLEVLKSGTILEIIDLSEKNYYVIGRLPTCDISMAHPTISRYHAVLQFRFNEDGENGKGIYIYDLGSTHGTFWNGNRIKAKLYIRLQGGHIIRFGYSQRKFIVQAPLDDQEQESEYSITELKKMRKLELQEKERLEKQKVFRREQNEKLIKAKQEIEGIDWGMGEDADEDTDLTENPYAQTNNEELFLDDPKKTLRGWFEREGFDLQYQTEDKGIGKFLCYVNLPVDHIIERTIRVESLITGKKKEAVVQCALEACRVLDRYGLLRQANHEARKKKCRNWEEEDYYDSDEDNFLDRTGIIERKREQRMKLAGKLESKVETYYSLLEKYSNITEKIAQKENTITLQKLRQIETDDSNIDALDAYMSTLESSTLNNTEIRKIKMELFNLRKEEVQLLKLINITKPANLPPLEFHFPSIIKKPKDEFKNLKSVIGQKKKKKCSSKKFETTKLIEENININKYENQVDKIKARLEESQENNELVTHKIYDEKSENYFKNKNTVIVNSSEYNMKNYIEDNKNLAENNFKKMKKDLKQNKQIVKNSKQFQADCKKFSENYSMWLPPENQSGDGKTSLNEKFGY